MYAGVGTMTADPGVVKFSIASSNAAITSGTWCTRSGSTFQP